MFSNVLKLLTSLSEKLSMKGGFLFGDKTFRRLIGSMTLLGLVSTNSSGCAQGAHEDEGAKPSRERFPVAGDQFDTQRKNLVNGIRTKGVTDERVLKAMESVPRHSFVLDEFRRSSYDDNPLPIGDGQTISQPFIVAYMTEALGLKPEDRVLEIGTGSGYQAAILAHLAKDVYSVEIIPDLAEKAKSVFTTLGIKNVHIRTGDGYKGWAEAAPFDAIIITAAPPEIPPKLIDQLKVGGRLVVPVGKKDTQWLIRLTKKSKDTIKKETLLPVRFVPMVPDKNSKPVAN